MGSPHKILKIASYMIFHSVNLVLSKIITTFAPQTHAEGVCTTPRLREQTYLYGVY